MAINPTPQNGYQAARSKPLIPARRSRPLSYGRMSSQIRNSQISNVAARAVSTTVTTTTTTDAASVATFRYQKLSKEELLEKYRRNNNGGRSCRTTPTTTTTTTIKTTAVKQKSWLTRDALRHVNSMHSMRKFGDRSVNDKYMKKMLERAATSRGEKGRQSKQMLKASKQLRSGLHKGGYQTNSRGVLPDARNHLTVKTGTGRSQAMRHVRLRGGKKNKGRYALSNIT